MKRLKEALFLSDKGYSDLKKAIFACTLTNITMLLPFCITVMIFSELLNPFVGKELVWEHIWLLWGAGVVSAILVFWAAKNDYRKTYIASYKESNVTRLRIAEHLRKLPMSFFNTKDLSELTTNMMSDCSSMESMLSSTIPPLIANVISATITCILLAFFDWRLAICVFITMPLAFLIIWLSRKYQKKLFERQVDAKLQASSQVQEYLEGMKIIKSCNLSGSQFSTLNKALLAMKKIAVKVEMVVGVFMSGASMILQAGVGITIFVGTLLLLDGQIELLPLLMFFLIVTKIYGPILAILSQLTTLLNLNVVTERMRTLLTTPVMSGKQQTSKKYDIELSHVSFAYNEEEVIHDVSCKIPQGNVTALVGPSGSGKSTLLHILSGLDNPTSGQVLLDDKDIYKHTEKELSALRRKSFGFVFQQFNLLPVLTASENISMPVLLDKKQPDKGYLNEISSLLGIADRLNHLPHELSGGQQQRVAIARALIAKPDIIFADEPTGNLDSKSGSEVMNLLIKTSKQFGKTLVVITHDDRIAKLADRKISIIDGVLMEVK